ncbi:hypothetical protein PanWU01x14_119160, partial [Parasponia andersonii]
DHKGVIRAAYANVVNFTNPLLAEAAALLAGIRTAIFLKFDYVVFDGDTTLVYNGLIDLADDIEWDTISISCWTAHISYARSAIGKLPCSQDKPTLVL